MRSAPCGSGWVPPHGSVGRVASQLGRGKVLARLWVGQALIEEGQLPGRTSQDAARVHREGRASSRPGGGPGPGHALRHQDPPGLRPHRGRTPVCARRRTAAPAAVGPRHSRTTLVERFTPDRAGPALCGRRHTLHSTTQGWSSPAVVVACSRRRRRVAGWAVPTTSAASCRWRSGTTAPTPERSTTATTGSSCTSWAFGHAHAKPACSALCCVMPARRCDRGDACGWSARTRPTAAAAERPPSPAAGCRTSSERGWHGGRTPCSG